MRSRLILLMCTFALSTNAQVPPTARFDIATGNFLIQFQGSSGVVNAIFEPATKIVPSVRARVVCNTGQVAYTYSYQLANGHESKQRLLEMAIDLGAQVAGIERPNSEWTAMMNSNASRLSWAHTLASPDGIETDFTGVALDSSASGFSFTSSGLPSICNCYFRGVARALHFDEEPPYEIEDIIDSLTSFPRNLVVRSTLGPSIRFVTLSPLSFLDTMIVITSQAASLAWISDQSTANKYLQYFSSARDYLQQNNPTSTRATLQQVLQDVNVDSSSRLTSEAYALICYNTEYLLTQLPTAPPPGLVVKLINSTGTKLTGGLLQYYDGSWKDATNNNDGTFSITTSLKTLSLRMTYEYGSQTKSNVTVGPDMVFFQTVSAQVNLQNSQGALMDTGSVQYYAGAWRTLGTTTSGVASKELLPGSYSFRMTYAGGSNDKQQDIGSNPVVVFQTVSASVQLKNSLGAPMDQGAVQYYAGAWRNFGLTTNGTVTKELLPSSYSFRLTYAYGSKDLQQNIGTNPVVVFQTANATVQLKNSQGVLIDQGSVQYYAGAWRTFGTTNGGTVSKELLPISYSFRMTNEGISNDKTQDVSTNSTVSISTVLCTVSVKNSQGQPVNNAMISYYSGAWRQIGPTVNGQITKELLPANLTFRMTLGTASQDKVQNIGTSSLVEFVTQ